MIRKGAGGIPRDVHTSEKFSTAAIFHAEVEMVFGLEGMVESDDEGMVTCGKDLLFSKRPLDLVSLDHFLLAQHCKG